MAHTFPTIGGTAGHAHKNAAYTPHFSLQPVLTAIHFLVLDSDDERSNGEVNLICIHCICEGTVSFRSFSTPSSLRSSVARRLLGLQALTVNAPFAHFVSPLF